MNENINEALHKLLQDIIWSNNILSKSEENEQRVLGIIKRLKEDVATKEEIASSIMRNHLSPMVYRYFLAEKTSGVNDAMCREWYETERFQLQTERKNQSMKISCSLTLTILSFFSNIPAIETYIENLLTIIPKDNLEKGLLSVTLFCALYTLRLLKQLEKTDKDWQDIKELQEFFPTNVTTLKKKKEL